MVATRRTPESDAPPATTAPASGPALTFGTLTEEEVQAATAAMANVSVSEPAMAALASPGAPAANAATSSMGTGMPLGMHGLTMSATQRVWGMGANEAWQQSNLWTERLPNRPIQRMGQVIEPDVPERPARPNPPAAPSLAFPILSGPTIITPFAVGSAASPVAPPGLPTDGEIAVAAANRARLQRGLPILTMEQVSLLLSGTVPASTATPTSEVLQADLAAAATVPATAPPTAPAVPAAMAAQTAPAAPAAPAAVTEIQPEPTHRVQRSREAATDGRRSGKSRGRKARRSPSPSYSSSSSGSDEGSDLSDADGDGTEPMEQDDQPAAAKPPARDGASRQLRMRVDVLLDEARNRLYGVPDTLEEAQGLQLQHLRSLLVRLEEVDNEIYTYCPGEQSMLARLHHHLAIVRAMIRGADLAAGTGPAAAPANPKRPNKLPERKFKGTAGQRWRDYVTTDMQPYFELHRVADREQGILAYLSLDTNPRLYVNAAMRAPVEQAEHQAWLHNTLGGVHGLAKLSKVLNDNPLYGDMSQHREKIRQLNALRIQPDASDFNAKFERFSALTNELHTTLRHGFDPQQRVNALLDMVQPCDELYQRIRTTKDHRDWWDGVADDAMHERAAFVESELLAAHRDYARMQQDRKRARMPAAAADGERKIREHSKQRNAPPRERPPQQQRQQQRSGKGQKRPSDGAGTSAAQGKKPKSSEDKPKGPRLPAAVAEYRRKHRLCFRCGADGHSVADCNLPAGDMANVQRDADAAAAEPRSANADVAGNGKGKGKKQFGKGRKN